MSQEKTAAVQTIADWLVDVESRGQSLAQMATELAERLCAIGVPIAILSTSQQAYQPEVAVRNIRWTREEGAVERSYDHVTVDGPAYLNSPLKVSRDTGSWLRVRLDGPEEDLPYPVCRELKSSGHTDYFVKAMPRGVSTYLSVATDHPTGFSDDDIACLRVLLPSIMLRLELYCANYALTSLLHLYLGNNAAERVIQGAFRLGGTEDIDAVVWMCDLRGFTAMTEKSGAFDVLTVLNQYFSCVVSSVQHQGGEVLKFIGDAVLAIFPVKEDAQDACTRAIAAAKEAFAALDSANASRAKLGEDELQFGLALHLGRVFYGNIGTKTRLDFTVIGPTVNQAARIESLCPSLGRRFLVSESFSQAANSPELTSVGSHDLKGVAAAQELFTIDSL